MPQRAGLALTVTALILAAGVTCMADPTAQVTGTVTYRERIALPPDAVVEVRLEDVSLQDVAATVLAEQTIEPEHQVPIPFDLAYDPTAIDERHTYSVRATIRLRDNLLFVTDRSYPVLTRGHPTEVDLVLVRSGGGREPVADAALIGTRWILRTLGGEAIEIAPDARPPFLQLREEEGRTLAFGHAGCNRFNGAAAIAGSQLALGPLATTRMACPEPQMALEARVLEALGATRSYEVRSTWLVLSGDDGEVATLEAWYE